MDDRERPRPRTLTRAVVLDAAVALVEREGAAALTMRRLGAELGVEAMSLYHHVPGRDAVLSGMAEHLMSQLQPPPDGAGWQDAGEWFARQLRVVATSSPQTFVLTAMRPLRSAEALAPVEHLLAALMRGGATAPAALTVYRALASYARGYALAETAGFTVDASTAERREELAGLDAERFPILAGRAGELAELHADGVFEAGLRALVDGLADLVEPGGTRRLGGASKRRDPGFGPSGDKA